VRAIERMLFLLVWTLRATPAHRDPVGGLQDASETVVALGRPPTTGRFRCKPRASGPGSS
jgi:hypothetical protein